MSNDVPFKKLLETHLGQAVAEATVNKLDRMIDQGCDAEEIEKTFQADLSAQIALTVASGVVLLINPLTKVQVDSMPKIAVYSAQRRKGP